MRASYKKLWKLLVDKDMSKGDLHKASGLSSSTMTKLRKGEDVSMEALRKICKQQMAEKASPTLPTNCAVLP